MEGGREGGNRVKIPTYINSEQEYCILYRTYIHIGYVLYFLEYMPPLNKHRVSNRRRGRGAYARTYVCARRFMATCILPLYSYSADDSRSSFRCCRCIGSPCCTLSTFDHIINKFNVNTVRASNLINAGLD